MQKLKLYYGNRYPATTLRSPHDEPISAPAGSFSPYSEHDATGDTSSRSSRPRSRSPSSGLEIILISAEDGRDSIVDFTRQLASMAQQSKISPADITMDVVDEMLTEEIMGEPDLVVLFGPYVELSGYPPWQIRLSELYHRQDNYGVEYHVFLRALHKYADAKFNLGR